MMEIPEFPGYFNFRYILMMKSSHSIKTAVTKRRRQDQNPGLSFLMVPGPGVSRIKAGYQIKNSA
jgi:hypothetical protein